MSSWFDPLTFHLAQSMRLAEVLEPLTNCSIAEPLFEMDERIHEKQLSAIPDTETHRAEERVEVIF